MDVYTNVRMATASTTRGRSQGWPISGLLIFAQMRLPRHAQPPLWPLMCA